MLQKYFKQLLTLSVKPSYFPFNDVYYKHVDGVAIVSHLGPRLENLLLVYCEHIWLEKGPLQLLSKYCHRYVDNIFLTF